MIKTAKKWIYKIRYILIILSALLGIMGLSSSFGYVVYPNLPITNQDTQQADFELKPNLNFLTNDTYKVLSLYGGAYPGNYPRLWNVFRNDNKLYVINSCEGGYDCDNINRVQYQGFLTKYCVGEIGSYCNNYNYNTTDISFFYDNDNYANPDYMNIYDWGQDLVFGFVYSGLNQEVLFYVNNYYVSGSLDISYNPKASEISNSNILNYLGDSVFGTPGGGGGNIGDIVTDTGSMTNFEAILGYNYTYGFNESYCYGGYPLSDIFYSTDNPENFTGFEFGSGAYIYDIYNAYSGLYFTSASQFYQSFYSRYLINNIASFYNYPKALYGIVERYAWLYDHYQTYDPNIGISKLVTYCELYKHDPDSLYTGGDISSENGYSNLVGEITDKWRYYESGPLSLLSGDNIKFGSDEFFTNILNKINNSIGNISNNAVGVIPRYILVVLVALILFRIISH